MESSKESKVKCYDGSTDVKVFVTRVELEAAIKGYTDEKKAQYIASRLVPPAFDVYVRLSADDKKDFDKIKAELLQEFERGKLNRDEAIHILSDRRRLPTESPQTFAYKLIELVKLSYPTFSDATRKTIAKDYYIRGVHPDMQLALKTKPTFAKNDIHAIATETVRLELAGIKSYKKDVKVTSSAASSEVFGVTDNIVQSIADEVINRLQLNPSNPISASKQTQNETDSTQEETNYASNYRRGGYRNRRGRGNNRRGFYNGQRNMNDHPKRCRSCQGTDHLIRNCPTRYCQACGNRGHDQTSDVCPNHEQ